MFYTHIGVKVLDTLSDTHLLACFLPVEIVFTLTSGVTTLSSVCSQRDFLCRTIIFTALCVVVAHLITVCGYEFSIVFFLFFCY